MTKAHSAGEFLRRYPFAAACAMISSILVAVLLIRFGDLDAARAELGRLEMEGKRIDTNVRNAARFEDQVGAIKAGVASLESKLISIDDVSGNQGFFYRLEASTGVHLSILQPQGEAKNLPKDAIYRPAAFKVVVEGSYAQIIAFFSALESGAHLYRMRDFTLQRASQPQDSVSAAPSVVLDLNMQLLATKQ